MKQINVKRLSKLIVIIFSILTSFATQVQNNNDQKVSAVIPNKEPLIEDNSIKIKSPKEIYLIHEIQDNKELKKTDLELKKNREKNIKIALDFSNTLKKFKKLSKISKYLKENILSLISQNLNIDKIFDKIKGKSQELFFKSKKKVMEIYRQINDLFEKIDKKNIILIQKPQKVIDIFKYDSKIPKKNIVDIPDDFKYKVVEIDLQKLRKKKNKVLMFDIVFPLKKKYTLVIDFRNISFFKGKKWNIKSMRDANYIYLRSTEKEKNKDSKNIEKSKKNDILLLENINNKINIYITPPKNDLISFKVNKLTLVQNLENSEGEEEKNLLSSFKYGFLDNSLSPLHVKSFIDKKVKYDPNKPILNSYSHDSKNYINNFNIASIGSHWKNKDDEINYIKFYIAEKFKYKTKIKFNKNDKKVFKSSNELIIYLENNNFYFEPKKLEILSKEFVFIRNKEIKPLLIEHKIINQIILNDKQKLNRKWLQVKISLQKGVISINSDENENEKPFIIENPSNPIFFKLPKNIKLENKNIVSPIPIEKYIDTNKNNKELLEDLWINWQKNYPKNHKKFMREIVDQNGKKIYNKYYGQYQEYKEDLKSKKLSKQKIISKKLTGSEWLKTLNEYTNKMSDLSIKKLGKKDNEVRAIDFYKIPQSNIGNTGGNWIIKHVLNGLSKQVRNDLLTAVDIARRKYKGIEKETSNDQNYNKIFNNANKKVIKSDLNSLYHFIEPYLFAALKERFKIEKENFDSAKNLVISKYLADYLKTPIKKGKLFNLQSIEKLSINLNNKKLNLQILSGFPLFVNASKTQTGVDQLNSLILFLKKFGFYDKFLDERNSKKFLKFANLNSYTDINLWKSQTSPQKLSSMIEHLHKIIMKVFQSVNFKPKNTLKKVINQIHSLKYEFHQSGKQIGPTPAEDIKNIINDVINVFVFEKKIVHYKLFSNIFKSSYIKNLVVSKNIFNIIDYYKDIKKDKLSKFKFNKLKNINKEFSYQPEFIIKFAINTEYYNIPFLLNNLSYKKNIKKTINNLLSYKLENQMDLVIPKGNKFIDFMSNPSKITKIGFLISGILLTLIGIMISIITFKFKIKSNNRNKIILVRLIFIVVCLVGVLLLVTGMLSPKTLGILPLMTG